MAKRGRKGKYHKWLEEENLLLIEAWARDGLNDEQISAKMGIHPSTLYDWQNKFPEITESLKKGKEVVDVQVENALLKRALGYEHTETKKYVQEVDGKTTKREEIIKRHVPADTTAQIFWLKNRKPEQWRDKVDVATEGSVVIVDDIS